MYIETEIETRSSLDVPEVVNIILPGAFNI